VSGKRLYAAVAAAAAIVHLGVLWNLFVLDDLTIIVANPLVHNVSGVWQAFGAPYFPPNLDASVYRPLPIATYALDRIVGWTAWFHAVNLVWHVGATVLVAVLARRWMGDAAGLVAGMVFAVHPVHVEAVANVVGRNELMAALFTLLAVYAALDRGSVFWSAAAMAAGVLSKENAAVAPGLVAWAWLVGVRPVPSRPKLVAFVASWLVLGAVYTAARWAVLHGFAGPDVRVAPVFLGQDGFTIRLTAIAAVADVARLLIFPLALSADYSPDEWTAVRALWDGRLVLGVLVLAVWALLLALAWRRGRKVEAYGLGWMAIAYSPVANLLFPVQILIAERALYLPSAGLAIALGAALRGLAGRRLAAVGGLVFLLGGLRTALRVPAWRDDHAAALALLRDAPRSYFSWQNIGWQYLRAGRFERAMAAFRFSARIFPHDARSYIAAAHAAYALDRSVVADSLLAQADAACERCVTYYMNQASFARLRGDVASADSLVARARRLRPS
jgi:protein O-mannosyl-transferase